MQSVKGEGTMGGDMTRSNTREKRGRRGGRVREPCQNVTMKKLEGKSWGRPIGKRGGKRSNTEKMASRDPPTKSQVRACLGRNQKS